MVLVDSDVWSEAFRSKGEKSRYVRRLQMLIEEDEVIMIGMIRQEVLSGIKEPVVYDEITKLLQSFPSQRVTDPIHEMAAKLFNECRRNGIQGSHTDFLICACCVSWNLKLLTKDKDFGHYQKFIPLEFDTLQ